MNKPALKLKILIMPNLILTKKKYSTIEGKIFIGDYITNENNPNKLVFSIYQPKYSITDPIQDETLYKKEIILNKNIFGNNQVQFDSQTKDVYFSTEDGQEFGTCPYQNKTCKYYLSKINLTNNEIKPSIIYESEKKISKWLILQNQATLLTFNNKEDQTIIKKINLNDNQLIKEYTLNKKLYPENYKIKTTVDEKFLKITHEINSKNENSSLNLYTINLETGEQTEKIIFESKEKILGSNISPNDNFISFIVDNAQSPKEIYIYDLKSEQIFNVPYEGNLNVINLFWSNDDFKFAYILKNRIEYYDLIEKKKQYVIPCGYHMTCTIYNWSPNNNHFLLKTSMLSSLQEKVLSYGAKNQSFNDTGIAATQGKIGPYLLPY
jgi:hypothetical protein